MSTKADGLRDALAEVTRRQVGLTITRDAIYESTDPRTIAAAICDELGITREMVEHLYHGRAGSKNEAVNALSTLLDVAGR